MPDPNPPGGLPPDVPPEYAEAYRRGYENAYRRGAASDDPEATDRLDVLGDAFRHAPPRVVAGPAHRGRDDRSGWLVPLLLGVLALALVLAAYGLGRLFSGQVGTDSAGAGTDGVIGGKVGTSTSPAPHQDRSGEKKYHGPTRASAVGGATATCQSTGSVDAAGNQVSYEPRNVYDGDLSTAWRCDGDGVGQRLTITLPATIEIGEVGLVPGYAKTDARSGADRYAQNNRITKARWTFDDGSSFTQSFDGSPDNRELQTLRIPATRADRVVVEILATTAGPRDTTAVSEVRIGEVD